MCKYNYNTKKDLLSHLINFSLFFSSIAVPRYIPPPVEGGEVGFIPCDVTNDRFTPQTSLASSWETQSFSLSYVYQLSVCNPFTLSSDQNQISPYSINKFSHTNVSRREKNINKGVLHDLRSNSERRKYFRCKTNITWS